MGIGATTDSTLQGPRMQEAGTRSTGEGQGEDLTRGETRILVHPVLSLG